MAANNTLDNRVIVITGASSGFGRGLAAAVAAQGAVPVLAARRTHALRQLAEDIGNAAVVTTDVGDPNDVENLAQAALSLTGRIDAWVNNAGVGAIGNFADIPLADHQRVIATNLGGVISGSHAALRAFRAQGSGTLVNVASMLGKTPAPYCASYVASKFGILGLCASLRQELAADGFHDIHVCAALPMAADTPFYDHAANYTGRELMPYPYMPAEDVVAALVDLIQHPRDEATIGLSATAAVLSQQIAPGLTETVTRIVTRELQMEQAASAPMFEGNLHRPVEIGTGVVGSLRARQT